MGAGTVDSVAALAGWLIVCYGAAAFGSRHRPGAWYAALRKPRWTPPGWIFAPVWSVLYTAMAVAAWLVWRSAGPGPELVLFAVQLALNAAWSWIFFGRHRPGLALADIVALWLAIAATLLAFRHARPLAAWLLVPYLAWVAFAAALNAALWRLNRPVAGRHR
jgi:translocator protein